ncbi:uncharacterized protein LOC126374208 isoform X2 [Pectinophora gossypiella]|uniref:uncharacterized protein LOC126374208 isoform X2 n=1 Tax=Pectinophora gossypiella TaxID=13191 RepID=UPI00214DF9F3|nr:uncharacterized protein LOC126374208 isoform X2 [Pectinophora gossypiella]
MALLRRRIQKRLAAKYIRILRFENPEGMGGQWIWDSFYEVFIQCPQDDTSKLEEALKNTKLVNWAYQRLFVPVAPPHIFDMLQRLANHFGKKFTPIYTDRFILDDEKPPFEVSLPPGTEFKRLSPEHAELVESKWPHRYAGAVDYVLMMIRANSAYGLFLKDQLVSWMLITEVGNFNNLYTLEDHRGKGYAEIVVKLVSNEMKRDNKHAFGFVVKGNVNSFNLFTKLGFTKEGYVNWCFLDTEDR